MYLIRTIDSDIVIGRWSKICLILLCDIAEKRFRLLRSMLQFIGLSVCLSVMISIRFLWHKTALKF